MMTAAPSRNLSMNNNRMQPGDIINCTGLILFLSFLVYQMG